MGTLSLVHLSRLGVWRIPARRFVLPQAKQMAR